MCLHLLLFARWLQTCYSSLYFQGSTSEGSTSELLNFHALYPVQGHLQNAAELFFKSENKVLIETCH